MRMTTDFRILAGLGLAGLAAAAFISFQMPNRYRSEAVARVALGEGTGYEEVKEALLRAEGDTFSRTSLSAMIQNPELDLYRSERQTMPLEDVIEQMKHRDLKVDFAAAKINGHFAFKVSYVGDSAAIASGTTRRVLERLIADMGKNEGAAIKVEVLDPPSLPRAPVSPNRPVIVIGGLLSGVVLGVLIAGIRRWPRVALTGAAGALLAGALSFAIPNRYVSTAVLRVSDAAAADRARVAVLTDDAAMQDILRAAGPGTTRANVSIKSSAQALVVQVTSGDRLAAQLAAQRAVTGLVGASLKTGVRTDVFDPPSLPFGPVFPNHYVIAALGLAAGLGLAIAMRFRTRALLRT